MTDTNSLGRPTKARPSGDRALMVALFLIVSVAAFEATAVITALPTITDEFGGDSLYGLTVAVNLLANIVVIVTAAAAADRHGPGRPFLVCAAVYALGLAVAGAAPGMAVVVVGRTLQGAGVGGFGALAFVAVSRGIASARQPAALAVMSAGWVLPSLIAPAAAGAITEAFGWRWVFLGILPLLGAITVYAWPMLRGLPPASRNLASAEPSTSTALGLIDAIRCAAGLGIALWGLTLAQPIVAVGLAVAGSAMAAPAMRRLFPPGMFRAARGLPAVIAIRLVAAMAFLGIDSFMPLAADRIHGAGPIAQGMVIIGAALMWTIGQAVAAKRHGRGSTSTLIGTGLGLLAIGIAGSISILRADWSLAIPFAAWAIGGFGQGMVFGPAGTQALALAPEGSDGTVSAQINLADSVGFALMGGIGGAAVALADRDTISLDRALQFITALAFVLAVTAALVFARRIEPADAGRGREPQARTRSAG